MNKREKEIWESQPKKQWKIKSFTTVYEVTEFLSSLPLFIAESAKVTQIVGIMGIEFAVFYWINEESK